MAASCCNTVNIVSVLFLFWGKKWKSKHRNRVQSFVKLLVGKCPKPYVNFCEWAHICKSNKALWKNSWKYDTLLSLR